MKLDFQLAIRYLNKNKGLGLVNALGLSIGISACIVIYLIASYELSFNKSLPDRDRIFRLYTQYNSNDVVQDYPGIYTGAVDLVRDQVEGIIAFTHIHSWWEKAEIPDAQNAHKVFDSGNNFVFATPNFFEVFSMYEWLEGSPEAALLDPFKVVLTESRAKIYFGQLPLEQIIGKEIIYKDSLLFTVSGIVADIKKNTDFTFTDFLSHVTADKLGKDAPFSWDDPYSLNNGSRLFIKIAPGFTPEQISAQFPKPTDDLPFALKLQPLSDLHFNTALSMFAFTARAPVKKSTIEILIAMALALLTIAVINFINLETAQSAKRAKEVGVRKILGSSQWNLIRYFLVESFILTSLALFVSIGLAMFAFTYFKEFIPPGVVLDLSNPDLLLFLLLCLICIPILTGIYPAFVLSAYQPAHALKNVGYRNSRFSQSSTVRKGLTIFQFFLSQVLIIVTMVVGLQIKFMLDKDLGFKSKGILTFHAPLHENTAKKLVLKNSLAQIEGIEMVALQSQPPSGANGTNSLLLVFENELEPLEHWVNVKYGDANYMNLYNLRLIAGNNFAQGDSAKGYIINEAYMHKLGFSNPIDVIGKIVNGRPIIGVVANFHTESLHTLIPPTIIAFDAVKLHSFGVKLKELEDHPEKFTQTLTKIENAWKNIYPNDKFEYEFIDSRIRKFYESEKRVNKLAGVATFITILISCVGLFALSSFTALERTKEIGIRKVVGASVSNLVMLLSSEFLILVLIALIVSSPVAFYISKEWLTGFAFRMNLNMWIFIISGLLSVTLAFFTISFHTIKTAKTNPVKSLRYE